MHVALADHVIIVIMQFLERAYPWFRERLKDIPDHDLKVSTVSCFPYRKTFWSGCVVSELVVSYRDSPVRALAPIMCSVSICWSHANVVCWYPNDFTTGNAYPLLARCSKQPTECPGSQPRSRFCCLVRDVGDRLASATGQVKMETDRAVSEERRRWNRLLKAQTKANEAKATDQSVLGNQMRWVLFLPALAVTPRSL